MLPKLGASGNGRNIQALAADRELIGSRTYAVGSISGGVRRTKPAQRLLKDNRLRNSCQEENVPMNDETHAVETLANPQTAADYQHRGWHRHTNKEYGSAEADFRQALTLDAQSMDAQYGLAMALKGLGKNEQAVEAFQKSISLAEAAADENRIRADMLSYLAKSHIKFLQS